MNTLENLNQRLNNNSNLFIDVYDSNTLKKLDKNQNANSILLFHNSLYEYYKSFYKKDYQEIRIIAKTKISKYFKRKELPINIIFKERIQHDQQQNNNIQQLAKFTKEQFNFDKLKKLITDLIKNKKKIKEINKYLYDIISEWHHPNKTMHQDNIFLLKSLKDFFKEITCKENDIIELMESLKKLYSISEIENYIDSLNNIMFNYIEYSNKNFNEPLEEYFINYKFIRNFLKDLKLLELEISKKEKLT